LGSAIKLKVDPGFDSCSNNWFCRRRRNHVVKCKVGTQQCKVRWSGFPLFFLLKLNTIPKELLSHKHLQPKKIEPCDGSAAIQLDQPHWIVWWVTNTGIHDGELNVQRLQTLPLWPWLQDTAVCTTTHIYGRKCTVRYKVISNEHKMTFCYTLSVNSRFRVFLYLN